jgi:hypothetical protein
VGDHVAFLLEPRTAHNTAPAGRPLFFSDIKSLKPGHPA